MQGLNKVLLIGNLGAPPELKQTGGGAVLKLRLATSERYLDRDKQPQERTEWHNVVIFGKRAEGLSKVLDKGSRLYVEGRLSTSSYDKDGTKVYRTEIVANDVLLQGGGPNRGTAPASPRPAQPGLSEPDDDDIPF